MELIIYNELKDEGKVFKITLDTSLDMFTEELDEWGNDNLEENGFYEVDILNDNGLSQTIMINIPDDEPDWKSNHNQVVLKVGDYLNHKMINYTIENVWKYMLDDE